MIKDFNYIKYPEDRLYLRVGNLCQVMKDNLQAKSFTISWVYLAEIQRRIKSDVDPEEIKRIESHLLSPEFINQKCFSDSDKQNLKSIIREYKLKQIL